MELREEGAVYVYVCVVSGAPLPPCPHHQALEERKVWQLVSLITSYFPLAHTHLANPKLISQDVQDVGGVSGVSHTHFLVDYY